MKQGIDRIRRILLSRTGRLTLSYLAVIMAMTILFSSIIFAVSSAQFDRPPATRLGFFEDSLTRSAVHQLFEQRAAEARSELIISLLFLNIAVLAGGALLSYYLARKTLVPIEAAMDAQGRFVSDASHELRTPLTALQVTNEVALRKKKLTIEQAKELIGHNVDEVVKLRGLTDALLHLVRQEVAITKPTTFKVADSLRSVIRTYRPVADRKSVSVSFDESADTLLTADKQSIEQIIGIFLDNAIKYSPVGATVNLDVSQVAGSTVISVTDQGPGIAPEHHHKIFDRFWRADDSRSSQHEQGNGLGLAIAKSIAERCGYELSVSSALNEGTTFSLLVR